MGQQKPVGESDGAENGLSTLCGVDGFEMELQLLLIELQLLLLLMLLLLELLLLLLQLLLPP